MEQPTQEQEAYEPQAPQEQKAVPTLMQLATEKVATKLIQLRELEQFINNPNYIKNLGINEEVSNAIVKQIIGNFSIRRNLTDHMKTIIHSLLRNMAKQKNFKCNARLLLEDQESTALMIAFDAIDTQSPLAQAPQSFC